MLHPTLFPPVVFQVIAQHPVEGPQEIILRVLVPPVRLVLFLRIRAADMREGKRWVFDRTRWTELNPRDTIRSDLMPEVVVVRPGM